MTDLSEEDRLATALSERHGFPPALTKHFAMARSARGLISAELARRYGVVPIGVVNGGTELVVAMRNPDDRVARESIAALTGYAVLPAVAAEGQLQRALDELYPLRSRITP